MPKNRQLRQRRTSSSDEEEETKTASDEPSTSSATPSTSTPAEGGPDLDTILRDTKELQKLRQRPKGVTAASLALGNVKKVPTTKLNELVEDDPWKVGGLVDMTAKDRNRDRTAENEKDMVNMGSTFAAETGQRDEDAEMCKYIEEEMLKRKKKKEEEGNEAELDPLELDPVFQALPEHLKTSFRKKGEEMLSSQMLSGIPEVDLGISEKIRNIEETEKAKKTLLDKKLAERRKKVNSFAPTNMAVNFVQHNRFNLEEPKQKRAEKPKEEEKLQPMVVGMTDKNPALQSATSGQTGKKHKPDSASDDYHFDKFKKAMRR